MIDVRPLNGAELDAALPDIARLRIEIFRSFPHLYDGQLEQELRNLKLYQDNPRSVMIGAFSGARLVGASTGVPLSEHRDDFSEYLAGTGLDEAQIFYCPKSVLLPELRGQGIGHRFFDYREDHARDLGFTYCAFSSVIRPNDHPARPNTYHRLDGFWLGRGYAPRDDITPQFKWTDIGDTTETSKSFKFWMHTL
jgi:GNAT superfamily N-acetyltransferase